MGLRGNIVVAPMAVDHPGLETLPSKRLDGHMVAIGRLTPSKRYDHAIRALALLRSTNANATLTLVGDGRDLERLRRVAAAEGVSDSVVFTGRASEMEKHRVVDAADVLVGTSVREGWGLTVSEAGARGVPSVVYDIPGFRDAVIAGRTGFVVEPTPRALADSVRMLMSDRPTYDVMRHRAAAVADAMTFERTADAFEGALLALSTRDAPLDS
jgi:glycosyltransferase involved in cell wall biosynthesis